jgi:hypothetical protein
MRNVFTDIAVRVRSSSSGAAVFWIAALIANLPSALIRLAKRSWELAAPTPANNSLRVIASRIHAPQSFVALGCISDFNLTSCGREEALSLIDEASKKKRFARSVYKNVGTGSF